MTKHECGMTKELRSLNTRGAGQSFRHSDFVIVLSCRAQSRHLSFHSSASSRTLDKRARRVTDFLPHARLGRNKLRRKPGKQADQIVRDQNLSVAMLA